MVMFIMQTVQPATFAQSHKQNKSYLVLAYTKYNDQWVVYQFTNTYLLLGVGYSYQNLWKGTRMVCNG